MHAPSEFPLAAEVVTKNRYVDDVLSGSDIIETACEQVRKVDAMFQAGGFRLRK